VKKTTTAIFIFALAAFFYGCQDRKVEYEDFLLTYFDVTAPDTALVRELMGKTRGHVKTFLNGLYYRDGYRLKANSNYYANADTFFKKLIEEAPDEYYGYAGRGLMFTELGMGYAERSQDELRQQNFDSAFYFLNQAIRREPNLAILYFYVGKNEFYRYRTYQHSTEINLNTIYYLDTALQKQPGFYKAYLRSGQYLSEYTIIARSNKMDNYSRSAEGTEKNQKPGIIYTPEDLERRVPRVHDRIKYLFSQCLSVRPPTSEVYLSMANASLTYFEFSRIGFLDSAARLLDKDSTGVGKILEKKSEIFYHDLKLYKTALTNYNKWLRPQDSARHWVAKSWCLFHGDSLARSQAFSVLRQRIVYDPTHADQYYFALGMMNNQLHKYQAALSELIQAKASALLNGKPTGYIQIEIAKIFLAANDTKRAIEILRKIMEEYYDENDPFNAEIVWSAEQLLKFYKLKV
jgi:tetratricopeptide (TPR) repeat protein